MILGKYYEMVFDKFFSRKICHLVDIFNGEQLAKDKKYMLGERYYFGIHSFEKDTGIVDFGTFVNLCKSRKEGQI